MILGKQLKSYKVHYRKHYQFQLTETISCKIINIKFLSAPYKILERYFLSILFCLLALLCINLKIE